VPDEHGTAVPVGVEQADEITGQLVDAVGRRVGRARRAAAAAHVRRENAKSGAGQGRLHVPPRVRELGEAVHEHHGRAGTLVADRQ
jgi:hypothetical protein